MREEKPRSSSQYPNPHCPRSDSPGTVDLYEKPSPLDFYTAATDNKPPFKTENMSPKQKTDLFGRVS